MSYCQKSLYLVHFRSLELKIFFNHGEILNDTFSKSFNSGAFSALVLKTFFNHRDISNQNFYQNFILVHFRAEHGFNTGDFLQGARGEGGINEKFILVTPLTSFLPGGNFYPSTPLWPLGFKKGKGIFLDFLGAIHPSKNIGGETLSKKAFTSYFFWNKVFATIFSVKKVFTPFFSKK